jgi:hypothetical protein
MVSVVNDAYTFNVSAGWQSYVLFLSVLNIDCPENNKKRIISTYNYKFKSRFMVKV